ncbi:hypothetical protein [Bradyrhizobium sp. PRIMUS42]|uniref:hypothetical protein n=1 Tax=Bradyrhizobium sp. PRIMUS42 TaxID=2908926 RepID=UPI001FF61C89|nr:hypothetical protein [Bradyrhizobium sp. PRIMUS42]MCJ9729552.1 hypothetical protein [Bradyrhizobium sp. PRIMUS42]
MGKARPGLPRSPGLIPSALIRDLATDPKKRELFARLADHLAVLASAVEQAISESTGSSIAPDQPTKP